MRNKGFALSVFPVDQMGKRSSHPYEEHSQNSKGRGRTNQTDRSQGNLFITCKAAQRYSIQITNGSSNHAAVEGTPFLSSLFKVCISYMLLVYIDDGFIGGYPIELRQSKVSLQFFCINLSLMLLLLLSFFRIVSLLASLHTSQALNL